MKIKLAFSLHSNREANAFVWIHDDKPTTHMAGRKMCKMNARVIRTQTAEKNQQTNVNSITNFSASNAPSNKICRLEWNKGSSTQQEVHIFEFVPRTVNLHTKKYYCLNVFQVALPFFSLRKTGIFQVQTAVITFRALCPHIQLTLTKVLRSACMDHERRLKKALYTILHQWFW